jgi:protein-tyrosine phosphatase
MVNGEKRDRHLAWDACYNVRDLGGYPMKDGGETRWRTYLRADNLCRLTPNGEKALVEFGVHTIIDLRNDSELALEPHPFAQKNGHTDGPAYLHLSLVGEDEEDIKAIDEAPSLEAGYVVILERFSKQMAGIITAIGDAAEGAVLFHCFGGKDRTGLVAAMLLALAGVPDETIAKDYAITDRYLQPFYDQVFREVGEDHAERERLATMFASRPETMRAVLSYLDREYGGVERYLLASGVRRQSIKKIRSRIGVGR